MTIAEGAGKQAVTQATGAGGARLLGLLVVPELEGACNRCGQCCASPGGARCEHLEMVGQLGQPEATRCRVYDRRYNGMPITMVRRKTGERRASTCWKDSVKERAAIVLKGLGRGCSLWPKVG